MNFDVGILLSSIATLSSLIQTIILLNDHKNTKAKKRLVYAETRMEQPLKTGTKVLSEVLTEEQQKSLYDEINEANIAIIEKITSKDTTSIKISKMKEILCNALHIIKQENDGILPTVRLNKLWEEYRCEGSR